MHSISTLPQMRDMMDFNLTGWDGGTVMGHDDHFRPIYNNPVDEYTLAVENFKQFNQAYTWPGLTEGEERLLYTPEYGKQLMGRAFESMRQELHPFWRFRKHYAAEFFYIVNHCWRMTGHMVTTARSHIEMRFPFWDYDLIDWMYSIRPEVRGHQILYRDIITRELPRLAMIPYDKQEYLPTLKEPIHTLHEMSVRVRRKLKLFPERATLYADYENYLRRDLRPWAESVLFDKRTEQRGIYNLPFVRSLMERHMTGREQWTLGKIAPLITFEMVMREFFD
jgi:asparagine synthase (glutamine-hydrolysing)